MFTIRLGVPEMEDFWNNLKSRKKSADLSKDEEILFKQLAKAIQFLAANPRHPG